MLEKRSRSEDAFEACLAQLLFQKAMTYCNTVSPIENTIRCHSTLNDSNMPRNDLSRHYGINIVKVTHHPYGLLPRYCGESSIHLPRHRGCGRLARLGVKRVRWQTKYRIAYRRGLGLALLPWIDMPNTRPHRSCCRSELRSKDGSWARTSRLGRLWSGVGGSRRGLAV